MRGYTIASSAVGLILIGYAVHELEDRIKEGQRDIVKQEGQRDSPRVERVQGWEMRQDLNLDEMLKLREKRKGGTDTTWIRTRERYNVAKTMCIEEIYGKRRARDNSQLGWFLRYDRPLFTDGVTIDDFAKVYSVMEGATADDFKVAYQALREYGKAYNKTIQENREIIKRFKEDGSEGGAEALRKQLVPAGDMQKEFWDNIMEKLLTAKEAKVLKTVHLSHIYNSD